MPSLIVLRAFFPCVAKSTLVQVVKMLKFRCSAVCFCIIAGCSARAEDTAVEFNRDIRPIFSDKCYTCHGPDAANRKTKLRFDVEAGAKIELSKGRQAIIPGDPSQSEVYRRVASSDPELRMPPAYMGREKLTDAEIGLIQRWIEQ